jgi:hypothetical protein
MEATGDEVRVKHHPSDLHVTREDRVDAGTGTPSSVVRYSNVRHTTVTISVTITVKIAAFATERVGEKTTYVRWAPVLYADAHVDATVDRTVDCHDGSATSFASVDGGYRAGVPYRIVAAESGIRDSAKKTTGEWTRHTVSGWGR